ncbi:MAG: hypothetical protein EAZ95_00795 [Bacteroidetes bacterium]|nr:MAG: hypothetical protein EAZ95_00795 [Bacteroidota bacterium]
MKKVVFSLLMSSSLFYSCTQNEHKPAKDIGLNEERVVNNSQDADVYAFAKRNNWDLLSGKSISWQDALSKYKAITNNAENQSSNHLDNFKQIVIQRIVLQYGLAQSANAESLEYCYQELLKCNGQNPEVVYNILIALKPTLGVEKTHKYAQQVLVKRKNYAASMQKSADKEVEKTRQEFRDYAQKLRDL